MLWLSKCGTVLGTQWYWSLGDLLICLQSFRNDQLWLIRSEGRHYKRFYEQRSCYLSCSTVHGRPGQADGNKTFEPLSAME